ncbi:cupin domain-containing protein [Candidatus Binatia bacterium]|nr:cupin domain-containing protein [Candidatus Binatia bacterium]
MSRRRSIRLPGYDYSLPGSYFFTVCPQDRACLFGEVLGDGMGLTDAGHMVAAVWKALPERFRGVDLDAFVVMPNHVHGIITIDRGREGCKVDLMTESIRNRFGACRHGRMAAILLVIGLLGAATRTVAAESATPARRPAPIAVESLRWASPPGMSGVEAAWAIGSERESGPYVLRVRLASGTRVPPHTHPDVRVTTVLSGTLYVGFGDRFEEGNVVAVPTGAVYVAPAGVPHFLWARDGDVFYQENGTGPTGTAMLAH